MEGISSTFCRALVSTANKTGLIPFLLALKKHNIEILATGSTAQLCRDNGIDVVEVADYTGFPEILDGRVKTLHPHIHAGILSRREQDQVVLDQHKIGLIDLVVVNLYPFAQTIAKADCTAEQAIENIDIGGPTLLRAAAKNHQYVTAVVDPSDYDRVLQQVCDHGNTTLRLRKELAAKVFRHTAQYDALINTYLQPKALPSTVSLQQPTPLRYGENPQQKAFLINQPRIKQSLAAAEPIQGKALSYNNLMDANAALRCIRGFTSAQPVCAIIKHATPCGMATGQTLSQAYTKALKTDAQSAFGGIVALNQVVDGITAQAMSGQFMEVLLAPGYSAEALEILAAKKNCRVLTVDVNNVRDQWQLNSIDGGYLIQTDDNDIVSEADWVCVTENQPSEQQRRDMAFAWQVVRQVKSNAIVYVKQGMTLGIGTGQTSRVFSAKIALMKAEEAGLEVNGAVMASDAFFPFADGVEVALAQGIKTIIQPGGSKRDAEVIAAANRQGAVMVFTGTRHFRH